MSDTKIFTLPDATSSTGNQLDPNLLLSMMNNGNGFNGGSWIWIIFLFFLYGWRNGGFLGNGANGTDSSTIASTAERDMLMQAINGNASAIQSLAGYLNSDVNSILTAINNVQSAVQSVGNQVGMSGLQVINAVQSGNQTIAAQIAQCCCDNKQLVTTMGYEGQLRDQANTASLMTRIDQLSNGITQGFSATSYETAQQTNSLLNSLQNQTQTIIDKLSAMESNAQQDKINTLTAQLTAANSKAERTAELAPIISELNAIKAAQPATATVTYPNLVGVPLAQALGYGYNTTGFWN